MDALETFVSSQRTENTRRAYSQDLRAWRAFLDGREPSEGLVIEWRDGLSAAMSNSTAIRRFNTVRAFYAWKGSKLFERIKAPSRTSGWVPHAPAESDIDKMLNVCSEPRDRAIMALLNNGLRAQEVCDLTAEDYYFEPAYDIWVLRVHGKGDKIRLVPANMQTVEALRGQTLPFRRLNIRKVYYLVDKWARKAGIEGIHPHALRHGYATRLVRAKVPVFSLQRLLGHQRTETTAIYVNLDMSDLVEANDLDPRNAV